MPLVIQHPEHTRLKMGPNADVAWANIGHGKIRWRIDTGLPIKCEGAVFHTPGVGVYVFDVPCGHDIGIGDAKLNTSYDSVQASIRVVITSPRDMRAERTTEHMPCPVQQPAESGKGAA